MHKQVQRNKLSHDHPHKCTSPQHYPSIKMGTTSHNNNLEDNGQGAAGGQRGGYGRGGGRPQCGRGRGGTSITMPYIGGNQLVPYVPGGMQQQPAPNTLNKKKWYTNQNVCYTCGFDVEDWHTSNSCPIKKEGHQNGFTCTNYMQYEQVGYPFCKKAMHKNIYPTF